MSCLSIWLVFLDKSSKLIPYKKNLGTLKNLHVLVGLFIIRESHFLYKPESTYYITILNVKFLFI